MTEIKVGDYVRRKQLVRNDMSWVYHCASIDVKSDRIFLVTSIEFPRLTIKNNNNILKHFWIESFEVVEPEIQVGDVYLNKEGKRVRIVDTDRKNNCNRPIVGLIDCGNHEECIFYSKDGICTSGHELILPWNQPPKTDWSKVAVDTLIEVESLDGKKHLRYFSHHNSAGLWFYNDGKTSDYVVLFDPKKCKIVI